MASKNISSNRRLPAWMKTVSGQSKEIPPHVSGIASSKNINAYKAVFHCELAKEKQADAVDSNKGTLKTLLMDDSALVHQLSSSMLPTLSAAEIIEQSLPLFSFKGSIVYSCHYGDCACLCENIISSLSETCITPVGFDMEWPVSFKNSSINKTALIQMCLAEDVCYLFHVSAMPKFPDSLRNLICDARLRLVGLNIESDLWKLERDYAFSVKPIIDRGSVVDVGKLANQKLKSCEQWSLDGLCRNVLRFRLNKVAGLRCGNWSEVPLNEEQRLYAATDALVGLLLYQKLTEKS